MRSQIKSVAVLALALAAAGCQKAPTAPVAAAAPLISVPEADVIADRSVAAWTSGDAAKMKALYAAVPAGFDSVAPQLVNDRPTWDKNLDGYAAMKVDRAASKGRKIQILAPDVFVVSESWDLTSTAIPANKFALRCTDVYNRDGGDWLIVTEHCSNEPKPG